MGRGDNKVHGSQERFIDRVRRVLFYIGLHTCVVYTLLWASITLLMVIFGLIYLNIPWNLGHPMSYTIYQPEIGYAFGMMFTSSFAFRDYYLFAPSQYLHYMTVGYVPSMVTNILGFIGIRGFQRTYIVDKEFNTPLDSVLNVELYFLYILTGVVAYAGFSHAVQALQNKDDKHVVDWAKWTVVWCIIGYVGIMVSVFDPYPTGAPKEIVLEVDPSVPSIMAPQGKLDFCWTALTVFVVNTIMIFTAMRVLKDNDGSDTHPRRQEAPI